MKRIFLAIPTISFLISCNPKNKTVEEIGQQKSVLESTQVARDDYKKPKEPSQEHCIFLDPDTSVAGIKIGDAESTLRILGTQTKLEGDSTHVFYSADKKQKLGLTVQPGDYYNQVSIFNISYAENSKQHLRQMNTHEFQTEKGIKLGISKKEVINKLGACYITRDSTLNTIELFYRLELPDDSRTALLASHNMPVYYASYRFTNNKLKNMEFGFEYP